MNNELSDDILQARRSLIIPRKARGFLLDSIGSPFHQQRDRQG
jgi:hypothetical protein